jgi:hypothetical protein
MDPVTIGAVVLAIVSGAAGEASGKLWDGLTALVRRPFHGHSVSADRATIVPSGATELAAVERAPNDEGYAVALGEALLARADADATFRQELESWWTQARQVHTGPGSVTNMISGGTQHGPVLQGRDFTGLTFNASPRPQPLGD